MTRGADPRVRLLTFVGRRPRVSGVAASHGRCGGWEAGVAEWLRSGIRSDDGKIRSSWAATAHPAGWKSAILSPRRALADGGVAWCRESVDKLPQEPPAPRSGAGEHVEQSRAEDAPASAGAISQEEGAAGARGPAARRGRQDDQGGRPGPRDQRQDRRVLPDADHEEARHAEFRLRDLPAVMQD